MDVWIGYSAAFGRSGMASQLGGMKSAYYQSSLKHIR